MPSLAFAGHSCVYPVTVTTNTVKWADLKAALKTDDAKYINVEKEPTHNAAGVAYLTCKEDYCGEVKKVSVLRDEADHVVVQRDLSLQEYADAMVAQKTGGDDFKNTTAAAYWVKTESKTKCYRENVNVCSCGYVGVSGTNVAHSTVNKKYDCVDYNCSKCGQTVKATEKHSYNQNKGTTVVDPANCGHGDGVEAECVCGAKGIFHNTGNNGLAHNYGSTVKTEDATLDTTTTGKVVVKSGYVGVNGAEVKTFNNAGTADEGFNPAGYTFYKLNNVKTEATTCGTSKVMNLVCETCGKALTGAEETSVAVAHDYVETKVPATCDSRSMVKKVCKVCGDEPAPTPATTVNDKLAHNYKVTKVAATCGSAEYYLVECTTCAEDCGHAKGVRIDANGNVSKIGTGADITNVATTELTTKETTKTKTYSYAGFKGELEGSSVIEVTISKDTPAVHKPGDKVLLKAATCESKEVWGKKCVECGKLIASSVEEKNNTALDHDYPVIKVDATCLNKAYEIKSDACSRCGKKNDAISEANEAIIKKATILGGAHSFDKWVETKASTVFEKGVESLVCSKCGAVDSKASIAKLKYAAPAVKAGKKSATVTVKATADAVNYKISYKKAGGSYKTIAAKPGKKTIKKLAKGKKYTFKVIAVNAEGVEVASATKTVKVK